MKPCFNREVLDNGMTVFLEKRDLPIVSVAFAVKNGAINEKISEKGISHFIEHMLYKGTPTKNSFQITSTLEKNGGKLNGFTDETLTSYWCKLPSAHLNVALDVLGDMIRNPIFDEEEMEKEKLVIFEEIKKRKDVPEFYLGDRITDFLYSGTLGNGLIGTYQTLQSIDRKKIIEKFNQFYAPNNLILGVVGDADFNTLVDFAKQNFSNERGIVPLENFHKINKSATEKRKGIEQANMIFAYHTPLSNENGAYAAELLHSLMVGGMSSRLFMEVREKRNLAYPIDGDSVRNKFFAYDTIYAGTDKKNLSLIEKIILKEFEKVSKELTEQELDDIKEQVLGEHYTNMEDSLEHLNNLLAEEADGDARCFYNFEKGVREVKLEEVKNLAKIENYSTFSLVPD